MNNYKILLFLGILLVSSCYNNRYLKRAYDVPPLEIEEYQLQNSEYKLQPYDYLYISVKSTNDEINKLYATISTSGGNNVNNNNNFFLTGYLISDSGYVFIPTLGDIYVKGKTYRCYNKCSFNKF